MIFLLSLSFFEGDVKNLHKRCQFSVAFDRFSESQQNCKCKGKYQLLYHCVMRMSDNVQSSAADVFN